MKRLIILAGLLALAATAHGTKTAPPLVDADWVRANACRDGVVVLDIRGRSAHARGHVPCAIVTDYGRDGWRETRGGVAGVLPPPDRLARLIGGLGIGNGSHVVVVSQGSSAAEFAGATRVFWTFKVLGHDRISVLNGGMTAWKKAKARVETGAPRTVPPQTFAVRFRSGMVPTAGEVSMALKNGVTFLDSRPTHQYLGINKSGKVKRPGTIPGALSLPALWTTRDGKGTVRDKGQLATLFTTAKVPTGGEQIVFCNTGHWASLGWFISSQVMGNHQAKMYDGSLAEWSMDPSRPMEAKVRF